MKRIMTSEKVKEAKSFEDFMGAIQSCYQEMLDSVAKSLCPVAVVDEPLLCAALEAFACAVKTNMDPEAVAIYETLKGLPVTGASIKVNKK